MRGAEPQEYSLYFEVWRHGRRCRIGREVGSNPLGQSTDMVGPVKAIERFFFFIGPPGYWLQGVKTAGGRMIATADQTDIRGLATA